MGFILARGASYSALGCKPFIQSRTEDIMKTLSLQEVQQVSGAALDPELGLFKPTGIALIDAIHKQEWNTYGRPLYNTFAVLLGFPKAP